jgi:hypothetical protein
MLTREELVSAGFREHPCQFKGAYCTGLWQKVCVEGDKKLYFINIYKWEVPYPSHYVVEVDLYQPHSKGMITLHIEFRAEKWMKVSDIEAQVADMYSKLGCVPDIHNN